MSWRDKLLLKIMGNRVVLKIMSIPIVVKIITIEMKAFMWVAYDVDPSVSRGRDLPHANYCLLKLARHT